MLRAFLIEPTSSRGPYDDKTTVTQRVIKVISHVSRLGQLNGGTRGRIDVGYCDGGIDVQEAK